jgi:hypothetical protein
MFIIGQATRMHTNRNRLTMHKKATCSSLNYKSILLLAAWRYVNKMNSRRRKLLLSFCAFSLLCCKHSTWYHLPQVPEFLKQQALLTWMSHVGGPSLRQERQVTYAELFSEGREKAIQCAGWGVRALFSRMCDFHYKGICVAFMKISPCQNGNWIYPMWALDFPQGIPVGVSFSYDSVLHLDNKYFNRHGC